MNKKNLSFALLSIILNLFGLSVCQAQEILSLTPNSGNAGQTLDVTITGSNTHFTQTSGTTTVSFGFTQGSSTINSVNVVSATSIIANVTIPSNTYTGFYAMEVYDNTDGYLYDDSAFYVNGIPQPVITNVSPGEGNAGQTLNITITGSNTHFTQGSGTIVYFDFEGTVNSLNVTSATSLTANVTIPSNTYTGPYSMEVYDDADGYIYYDGTFYVNGLAQPSITNVSPLSGNAGQTLDVTITGANTNFTQGSGTTVYFGFGGTVNSLDVVSSTSMIANVTISAGTYTGSYDVTVYDYGYGNIYYDSAFYVHGISPPAIANISPDTGNAGQTLNVTITGSNTHFTQGSGTTVYFDFGDVNSVNVQSNTSLVVNVTIPPNTHNGTYAVYLLNDIDGGLYCNCFNVTGCSASANFSINADTVPHHYTVINNATGAGTLQYLWNWGDDTPGDNVAYPNHTYAYPGFYTICLTVTDSTNCSNTYCDTSFYVQRSSDYMIYMTVVPPIILAVTQPTTQANNFSIYPNPVSDRFTVYAPFKNNEHAYLVITNMVGEVLYKSAISSAQSQIDVSSFSSGIYFLEAINDSGKWVGKFVKE